MTVSLFGDWPVTHCLFSKMHKYIIHVRKHLWPPIFGMKRTTEA